MRADLGGALSAARISKTIADIYDCALDPAGWPGVLNSFRLEHRYHNAVLSLIDTAAAVPRLTIIDGLEQQWIDRIPEYGSEIVALWGGPAKIQAYPIDEPLLLSRLRPRASLERNRYYAEWAMPQDLTDMVALPLARDTSHIGTLALGRQEQAGPITEADLAICRLYLPHLQRAVAISNLLDLRTMAAATFSATLNELTTAVFIVDSCLSVMHANAAAEAILARREPLLRTPSGRLSITQPSAHKALVAALQQCAENESQIGAKGLGIPLLKDNGTAFVLHVLPIRVPSLRAGLMPSATAALFIAPAHILRPATIGAVSALFGLTAMESRVLELIVEGRSNAQIAKMLDLGRSTIRTHLLHVFEKTGVHRQANLVALAASLNSP